MDKKELLQMIKGKESQSEGEDEKEGRRIEKEENR
jgi:hypothetical protein